MLVASVPPSRSVVISVLLAVISAGSLVAFSWIAGLSDVPTDATVTPISPAGVAQGLIVDAPAPPPPGDEEETARPDVPALLEQPDNDRVLGTRFENPSRQQKKERDRRGSLEPPRVGRKEDGPTCPCDRPRKGHSGNGHAYGHYKNKAQGHANGHASKPSHAGPPKHSSAPTKHSASPSNHGASHPGRGRGSKKKH